MKLDAPEITIFANMQHTHASAAQGGPATAPETVAATGKTTPVDADQLPLVDSAASNVLKKLTWANAKATLKAYFDTLYTNNTGTVTNVSALTLGTTGTNLSSTVATGTTTPVITLQVPNASATNRGALIAADWTTFNNKQAGGTYVTPTTLSNNTLPASVTNLATSGTNTMSALGAGIATFSAAGVISSTATTGTGSVALVEEGDWTLSLSASISGTITASAQGGKYTKIGRQVTVTGFIDISSVSSPTGALFLNGLPFQSGATTGHRSAAAVYGTGLLFNATTAIAGRITPSESRIRIDKFSSGVTSNMADSVIAGTFFHISLTYFV